MDVQPMGERMIAPPTGLPGLSMGLPPLSLATGPAISGATGGQTSIPLSMPFVFDNSGWNVNIKGKGNQSAQGSTGAAANAGGTPSFASGGLGGSLAGLPIPLILIAAGAWFLLR